MSQIMKILCVILLCYLGAKSSKAEYSTEQLKLGLPLAARYINNGSSMSLRIVIKNVLPFPITRIFNVDSEHGFKIHRINANGTVTQYLTVSSLSSTGISRLDPGQSYTYEILIDRAMARFLADGKPELFLGVINPNDKVLEELPYSLPTPP